VQTLHRAELRLPIETPASGDMCLQSAFTATIRAIVASDERLTVLVVRIPRHAPVSPLLLQHPVNHIQLELARGSRAFLLSTGVLQELVRLGGKKKPRNPPASAQQPRPPVLQLSPRSAGGKAPAVQPSAAKPPARPLACMIAAARITSPFSRIIPALPPRIRSPALPLLPAPLLERVP
jgi:hypothetical protein